MTSESKKIEAAKYTVDSAGNITGDHTRKPSKYIVVNNAAGEAYNGEIYANHNGHNGTMQLVGQEAMTVGTTYAIRDTAAEKNYEITTQRPAERGATAARSTPGAEAVHERPKRTGTNGTLYVGSGG